MAVDTFIDNKVKISEGDWITGQIKGREAQKE